MARITIKNIIRVGLKKYHYEGLFNEGCDGCGCEIDDLMPCKDEREGGEDVLDCKPGYKTHKRCETCEEKENCYYKEEFEMATEKGKDCSGYEKIKEV